MNASKIGFLGFGNMGRALALGALASGALKSGQLVVFDPQPAAQRQAKKKKLKLAASMQALVDECAIIFLCVKPQQMSDVVTALNPRGRCFVSIAAGVPLSFFEASWGRKTALIRVMPNTPALLRCGMSVMSPGTGVSASQKKTVFRILASVGDVIIAPEKYMDAVTAVSGSGPAYVFYWAEAMIAAAARLGLDKKTAQRLVRQTVFGAGSMLKNFDTPVEDLRVQVTSKGGTTEAAIKEFDRLKARDVIAAGLWAAAHRSKELQLKRAL